MNKKLICLVLAALMVLSIMPATAFAAQVKCERPLQFEENIATELKKLNLFKGVSETDFALRKIPTRIEALVIMLRLMGKESEILAGAYTHPFTDVPSWANNYVGYAYENGLTKGISASKFGTDNATDVQFLTFVLRAMGYSDSNGDFTWDNPYKLAEELGVLDCSVTTGKGFLRADCASISYNALSAKLKDNSGTLADKLIADGVFTKSAYDAAVKNVPDYAGLIKAYGLDGAPWYDYPTNTSELTADFMQCFLRGDYTFSYNEYAYYSRTLHDGEMFGKAYNTLLQPMMHIGWDVNYNNGKFVVRLYHAISPLTPEEITQRMIRAYDEAKKIREEMYSAGILDVSMSDLEKAAVCGNYLMRNVPGASRPAIVNNNKAGFADEYSAQMRGQYILYNGVYAVLIDHTDSCTDRAATYQLFMNIEGIKAVGAGCHVDGAEEWDNHMASILLIDGEFYAYNWGGGFAKLEDAKERLQLKFFDDQVEQAKQMLEKPYAFDLYKWN